MLHIKPRPIHILIIDDDPGDVRLIREAMHAKQSEMVIHEAENGIVAMNFLKKKGPYNDTPSPELILLDLNMPVMDGREVLLEIQNDPELNRIPLIVLSSSRDAEDILHAYDLHANCYINKPSEWRDFHNVIKVMEEFWLDHAKLPKN